MILKILTLINNKPWHWWTSSCGKLRSMSISFALWNWIVFLPLILILNLLLKPRTLERKAVVKIIETNCLCQQFKIFNRHPLWILFSQAEKICFDIFLQSPNHNLQKSNFNKSISNRMTDLFQFVFTLQYVHRALFTH